MSNGEDRFAPLDPAQIGALILAHPLAWVVSPSVPLATALPLRPLLDARGRLSGLRGHFALANLQVAALRRDPRVMILFTGPNGYVSPSWLADRTQAPTWIYATVQVIADLRLADDAPAVAGSLEDLTEAMERGRDGAWALDEMGVRYERLARRVAAFTAEIVEVRAKFKLGQDEGEAELHQIITALAGQGDGVLLELVRAANAPRLADPDARSDPEP